MSAAESLAIVAAGVFFLNGLLTGVWKYLQMRKSPDALAHPYVDIAHRTSLMYSFAAILLAYFARIADLPETVAFWSVLFPLVFFAGAILTYMIHGALKDTDNQIRKPSVLGRGVLPPWVVPVAMWALVIAEIGGFVVLFYGVLRAVVL
ncbi:MAG: hypothetical protein Q8L72_06205 [Moraxellaceae bacterium]|nr:hypothetical protein [Moraxellaceae bacterium]